MTKNRSIQQRSNGRKFLAILLSALLCFGTGTTLCGCTVENLVTVETGKLSRSAISENAPVATTYTAATKTSRPSVTPVSRNAYTNTSSAKTATVLVYIVGSDLESDGGAATRNLNEMCKATLGSNLRVLVQAGGCTKWQNSAMASGSGRYEISNGQIKLIQDLGQINTLTSDNLANFISWGASYAPADRTDLIMWDHGGGTISGFGSDPYFESSTLTLANISEALGKAKVHLDFLGFDACLMGTVETGYAAREWADYLIASEELEPGEGWQYTDWLSTLAANPSISTVDLGKTIVDGFIKNSVSNANGTNPNATLSVIDLTKIDWLYGILDNYFQTETANLSSNFSSVSLARGKAKTFGDNECDQIDMVDFLDRIGSSDASKAAAAVESVVAYTAATSDLQGANGLAMYFPYTYPDSYSTVSTVLNTVGFSGNVRGFCDKFTSMKNAGKTTTATTASLASASSTSSSAASSNNSSSTLSDDDEEDWYYDDEDTTSTKSAGTTRSTSTKSSTQNDASLKSAANENGILPLTEKIGSKVLKLSDAQWNNVVEASLDVYVDEGEKVVDFGCDDVYDFDDDGDLVMDFDHKWYAINGQFVPFYTEGTCGDDDNWYTYGYVPAKLNGTRDIDIMIFFNKENIDGKILGYRYVVKGQPSVQGMGYKQFKDGDKIDFIADYYDKNGNYLESGKYGNQLTYSGPLTFSLESLEGKTARFDYGLKDVYGNTFYTELLPMS